MTRPISSHQTWSIKDLSYGFREFFCRIHWVVPSGQDSSTLLARVANHSTGFGSSCLLVLECIWLPLRGKNFEPCPQNRILISLNGSFQNYQRASLEYGSPPGLQLLHVKPPLDVTQPLHTLQFITTDVTATTHIYYYSYSIHYNQPHTLRLPHIHITATRQNKEQLPNRIQYDMCTHT